MSSFRPGDLVRRFAGLRNWPVAERTIMVEGQHDQRYFELADRLYAKNTGLRLLGKRVSLFPTGLGEEGGAYGLQRDFHPLRAIMDIDLTPTGQKVFHAIALFDDDIVGKRGFAALTSQHLNYKKWRDIFLLRRVLPRNTRDLVQLTKSIDEANAPWKGMDCEIEDLVSNDVINAFISEMPSCISKPVEYIAGGTHCYFKPHFKTDFIRFVETYALLKDVAGFVDFLKSLRYHLGLSPEGDVE